MAAAAMVTPQGFMANPQITWQTQPGIPSAILRATLNATMIKFLVNRQ
jgi:hypothetical protein